MRASHKILPVALGSLLSATLALPALAAKTPAAGGSMPDLIVDQASLRQHWVTRVEDFPADFCSVVEGGITPGEHTVLRFTVSRSPGRGATEERAPAHVRADRAVARTEQ